MASQIPLPVAPSQGGPIPNASTPEGMAQYQQQLDRAATYVPPQYDPTQAPQAWGGAPAAGPGPVVEARAEIVPAAPAKKTRAKKAPAGTGAAAAAITPELTTELEQKREQYAGLLRVIQNFPVETQEQCQDLVDTAADAKAKLAELTEQKESITKPLNAALTATRRLFDPPIKFLESCERAIKDKLEARFAAQRADQARALQAVQAGAGRADAQTMAVATGADLVAAPEGSYEVEDWHCEITDPTQLPAAYWIPNMEMLADIAARQKSGARVPGVRFFSTKRLAIRKAVS